MKTQALLKSAVGSGECRCERAVQQGTHLRVWTLESDHLVSKQSRLLTSLVT